MSAVDYDDITGGYFYRCPCGSTGVDRMRVQDAEWDAEQHDQLHEDGVI